MNKLQFGRFAFPKLAGLEWEAQDPQRLQFAPALGDPNLKKSPERGAALSRRAPAIFFKLGVLNRLEKCIFWTFLEVV